MPRRKREKLKGWREIAEFLGVSDRHAMRMPKNYAHDPPPVWLYLGRVYAWKDELSQWKRRRDKPYLRPPSKYRKRR